MKETSNITVVKGLQTFAHGAVYGKKGDMMELPTAIANELAAAGLVETVTEKTSRETPKPPVSPDVPPAENKPAEAPSDTPEVGDLKAAAVAHNKMAKPAANKGK